MNIVSTFSSITGPRDTWKISYLLTDIIGLTLIAVIACCETYDDIEEFCKAKADWLRKCPQLLSQTKSIWPIQIGPTRLLSP